MNRIFAIVGAAFCLVVLVYLISLGYDAYQIRCQVRDTERICAEVARKLLYDKDAKGVDVWGRELKTAREECKDGVVVVVKSAGLDGQFSTADDITTERIKVNWTRLAGKVAGKSMVRFSSGFKEGVAEERKKEKDGNSPN